MSSLRLIPATGRSLEVLPEHSGAVVGRSSEVDYTLEDGSVSRRHARLEWRGDSWYVVDLGSANGTFVDGERVGEAAIRAGQQVRFGSLSLRAEVGDAAGSDATMAIPGLTAIMPATPGPRESEGPTAVGAEVPAAVREAAAAAPPLSSPPPPPASPPPPPGAAASVSPSSGAGAAPASPVGQMAAPPVAKKGKSPFFWIAAGCGGCLVVVLLVVAAIGGGLWWLTKGPAEDTRAELQRIGSGQLEAAYSELAESYQAELSLDDFQAMVATHPALESYTASSFNNVSVVNDRATLGGTLTSASAGDGPGLTEPVVIELVKERGQWRIAAIHFSAGE